MPQLDFVSFHYTINTLSLSYLFVYVLVSLFMLKPIFKEVFILYSYPTVLFLEVMLLVFLYSDKVVFTKLGRRTPHLDIMQCRVRKQWEWFKYIPKMQHQRDFFEEFDGPEYRPF
jgi:hypothetical protein